MSANNRQVGGGHYKTKYEHWDFTHFCLDGRYLEGCLTKYVSRHRKKNGIQDLEKALHYVDKLQEQYSKGNVKSLICGPWRGPDQSPSHFCDVNELDGLERTIILLTCSWCTYEDLALIRSKMLQLIEQEHRRIAALSVVPSEHEPGSAYVDQG